MQQDGLGVVVGVVGRGDLFRPDLLGRLGEKAVAHGAGGLFDALALLLGGLSHVPAADGQGNVVVGTPFRDEVLVPLGLFAPELVVEVRRVDHEVALRRQRLQHGQQRHRVFSPGHGAQNRASLGKHLILVSKCRRFGGQINRVLHISAPLRKRQ